MTEKDYLILLSTFPKLGSKRSILLLDFYKKASSVWNLKKRELIDIGINEMLASEFVQHRDNFNSYKYLQKLKNMNISCISIYDKDYPNNLLGLDGAPILLHVKGIWQKSDSFAVSIVGARQMTYYGKSVTERFSSELSKSGVTIISGLARGVDTIAHKSTLESGGRTIAVIGSGIDNIYPPENATLASEIIKRGKGLVISEYPLGYPVLPENFPYRNRIISGMSKVVIVIEGFGKSGTLSTASHAAEQGKTVFAVPGQITSPTSEAPHFLIKNGAKIAFSPKDVLDELEFQVKVDKDVISK